MAKYYDVVASSKRVYYGGEGCRFEEPEHTFFLSLNDLLHFLNERLDGFVVDSVRVNNLGLTNECRGIMIRATSGDDSTYTEVTYGIEKRDAQEMMFDNDGLPLPYSVTFDTMSNDVAREILKIKSIRDFCNNNPDYDK